MDLAQLIEHLCAAHGPAGDEGGVREAIAALARPYADEMTVDALGSLIVRKGGSGPRVMFSAHMDSIGFIVTHIEKEGFLRVGRVGGIDPKSAAYTPVRFQSGLRGVFVPEEKAEFAKLKLDACYLDIGAKDAEHAKTLVQVGDWCVFDAPRFQCGERIVAPYLDNRISCAILLSVLAQIQSSPNELYFVFTVQEEVGLRGAKTAAFGIDPHYGIAVDVTDVDDTPGSEKSGTVALGKGVAVKVMDSSVICHPDLIARLEQLATEKDIPTQREIMRGGGTDAGAIHTTRLGVLTGGLSIPCRYIHSPVETADLRDVSHCIALATAFAQARLPQPENWRRIEGE